MGLMGELEDRWKVLPRMYAGAQKLPDAAGKIGLALEVPDPVVAEPGRATPKESKMNIQANNSLYLPLLSAGVAALLVSGIALASLAMSPQGLGGVFEPAVEPEAAGAPVGDASGARAARCAECGVIESTRKIQAPAEPAGADAPGRNAAGERVGIEGKSVGSYAITIRLQDGSTRTVTDAHPARWRLGERVTLISATE
jgi:hypothetical protein